MSVPPVFAKLADFIFFPDAGRKNYLAALTIVSHDRVVSAVPNVRSISPMKIAPLGCGTALTGLTPRRKATYRGMGRGYRAVLIERAFKSLTGLFHRSGAEDAEE